MKNFLLIFCLLIPAICLSQSIIKPKNDEQILLNQDGTWEIVTITTLKDESKVALKDDGSYQLLEDKTKLIEDSQGLYLAIGIGVVDESTTGIYDRKVTYLNEGKLTELMKGFSVGKRKKIWVNTCINRDGTVTYVELDENNTDVRDKFVLKKAMQLVVSYQFEKDENAPIESKIMANHWKLKKIDFQNTIQ